MTDGNGSTIHTVLFDYRKACNLIDHSILVRKLCLLDLSVSIINRVIEFLSHRSQRIKLSEGCISKWDAIPSGVPQETELEPWLFVIMINDLVLKNALLRKYVDDTTGSEIIGKIKQKMQTNADDAADWSRRNKVRLNNEKFKELRKSFASVGRDFLLIVVGVKISR